MGIVNTARNYEKNKYETKLNIPRLKPTRIEKQQPNFLDSETTTMPAFLSEMKKIVLE